MSTTATSCIAEPTDACDGNLSTDNGPMHARRILLVFVLTLFTGGVTSAQNNLRRYDTPFYVLHSDLPEDLAREAATRMTALASEYSDRTRGFSGKTPRGMDFYLFSDAGGYHDMGGPKGSGGVFQSRWQGDRFVGGRLMAFMHGDTFHARKSTWQTIQHEGFHQFSALAIGGRKPPWIEEGFAEVFGYAEFCGDSFVTGVSPEARVRQIKTMIAADDIVPFDEMMFISTDEWNAKLDGDLYLQAWSMAYFLLYGEDGRYTQPTEQFMARLGAGKIGRMPSSPASASQMAFRRRGQRGGPTSPMTVRGLTTSRPRCGS